MDDGGAGLRAATPHGAAVRGDLEARSASLIAQDLASFGYSVTLEAANVTDPEAWHSYDLVVWACGDNTSPVAVGSYRDALEGHVADGGRLLIEGGELGYDAAEYPGYPDFAADVLHVSVWLDDESGDLSPHLAMHPVTTTPNEIGTIHMSYGGYGDQDACEPAGDAVIVCNWTLCPGAPSVLVYDDTPDPASAQIVFLAFSYPAADSPERIDLLENVAAFLHAPECVCCSEPSLPIPDPGGAADTLAVAEWIAVSRLDVYVDITHPNIGDLVLELTSPEGTTVRLHDGSGGGDDDIVGWYDDEIPVDGPGTLDDFAGELSCGEWIVTASDGASPCAGVLNEWCLCIRGTATGVGGPETVPERASLEWAHPNPFRGSTSIHYSLGSVSPVTIAVYTPDGRLVRTLVDSEMPAGRHVVRWNGLDGRGVPSASGVYLCRMETPAARRFSKIVLLR